MSHLNLNFDCIYCNRPFSLYQIPYELPCGHSYCRNCLTSFCKKSENEINCLKEEKTFILTLSKVPVSSLFLTFVEPLKNNPSDKFIICKKHNNAPISFICDFHNDYLCSQCSWDHCDHKESVRSFSKIDFYSNVNNIEEGLFKLKQRINDSMKKLADIKENLGFADEIKLFLQNAGGLLKQFSLEGAISENPAQNEKSPSIVEEFNDADKSKNLNEQNDKIFNEMKESESFISLNSEMLIKIEKKLIELKYGKQDTPIMISGINLGHLPEEHLLPLCEAIKTNFTPFLCLNSSKLGSGNKANVELICNFLKEKQDITTLHLKANDFGNGKANNFLLFSNVISNYKNLVVLNLSNNKLFSGDKTNLIILRDLLITNLTLQELDLENNDFEKASLINIKVFCQAIRKNKSLLTLGLKKNDLASQYGNNWKKFKKLVKALIFNSKLTKILLNYNKLSLLDSTSIDEKLEKREIYQALTRLIKKKVNTEIQISD